ncbi:MAG TPA: Tm-1-like ATP-binding domain-containing protein [Burkholderiaceae bacterium]|nr:Tm-1-like ATP-binding domain-containing protein [Burkholderiaceae bacterium]
MSTRPPTAWVVGTFDTKAEELLYLAGLLRAAGLQVVTVDVGTRSSDTRADIPARAVARHHPGGEEAVFGTHDRGQAVISMGEALCALVRRRLAAGEIDGMLGVGGSGGTSMVAPALRLLPIGRPKVLVSTMAAGNMAPFVDVADLTTMYPVTDIAGLNRLSRAILANAAHALAGMLLHPVPSAGDDRPALALTMFGVTTPCVQQVSALLHEAFDTQVFHANGAGGRTMEALAAAGMLQAVVDLTTTEVGQHLAGGVCDAGPHRLDAAAVHGLPWVGSVGALDMINWGAPETIPPRHRGRLFHVHNANVTLMRSKAEELQAAGRRIAQRLNAAPGPVRLLLPLGGLSALDAPGQPFHDPAADQVLFDTLHEAFVPTATHRLLSLPHHINDPAFAAEVARHVREVLPPRG